MKLLKITGTIVPNDMQWIYDFVGIDATSPSKIEKELNSDDDITIQINSGGGYIMAGTEIYEMIRACEKIKSIDILYAGSAASVIAMAGHNRISPAGIMMIHNVSGNASGDYREMDKNSNVLKVCNTAVAGAYQQKTGKTEKELLALMDKETWMGAEVAIAEGFVDEMINKLETVPEKLLNASGAIVLPDEAIKKIKNLVKCPDNHQDFFMKQAQAKMNFLNLRRK